MNVAVCRKTCSSEYGYCETPDQCRYRVDTLLSNDVFQIHSNFILINKIRCRVGWWGDNCDECFPYPGCKNGNCSKPWECNCQPGWSGFLCDQSTFCVFINSFFLCIHTFEFIFMQHNLFFSLYLILFPFKKYHLSPRIK